MFVQSLSVSDFRNIHQLSFTPSQGFNFICGCNGSGKSSVLESLYYLAHGRSFRTHLASRLIRDQRECFVVSANIVTDSGLDLSLGVQRDTSGKQRQRCAQEEVQSVTVLAEHLAIQFIDTDTHRHFASGPKLRRQFLDWGLFHVEHSFFQLWKDFHKLLKQRNAALKQQLPKHLTQHWDTALIERATLLTNMREAYVKELEPRVVEVWSRIEHMSLPELRFSYYPGWTRDKLLQEMLEQSYPKDYAQGYTQYGPQRGDLKIRINTVPAWDVLSQGQQKMLSYALRLAQAELLQEKVQKRCIFLIDDMPAELDQPTQAIIGRALAEQGGQVFITGIEADMLNSLGASIAKHAHGAEAMNFDIRELLGGEV